MNVQSGLKNVELSEGDTLALLVRPATSNATDINHASMSVGEGF